MFNFSGCTCDDTELPHHVSTNDEISRLMTSSLGLLRKIGAKISAVTIARSSLDDFCPQDQVRCTSVIVISQLLILLVNCRGFCKTLTLEILELKYLSVLEYVYIFFSNLYFLVHGSVADLGFLG